ncbi:hypothetical protein AAFF_G00331340 [Aldrovandia affinis]|uniref:Uncharacterized protein n=1 Tax=Aldrovandia affinis TaxID=143900 RepID=A0AAD7R6R8_9TELE|nr:hypothetical protein AAFF_G00331340 [Aldrovandia affinis]
MDCQVSQEIRDTEEREGSPGLMVLSEIQERRVRMDLQDQEDNQESLGLVGLWDQEDLLGPQASLAFAVWTEFKGQRETWDPLGRRAPQVSKETLDTRACLVLRVPLACLEKRVLREREACMVYPA